MAEWFWNLKRTAPFHVALAVFLITAGIGVWAAYDPGAAWFKFWLIAGGVGLYYLLASFAGPGLKAAGFGASLLGGLLAAYSLLTWDARAAGTGDLAILVRAGQWWLGVRPSLDLPALAPNAAGGALAMLLPFQLATGLRAWKGIRIGRPGQGEILSFLFSLLLAGLTGTALLLTSSRGAWLALLAGLGLWLLWEVCGALAGRLGRARWKVFLPAALVLGLAALGLAFSYPGGIIALANRLPGLPSGTSRWEIARHTASLAMDYVFTGGGLGSFPGLYSQWVAVTPFFLFGYSHNLYLDLALEQGLLGLLAFAALWLFTAGALVGQAARAQPHWLSGAALAAWTSVSLHGLVDDAFYSSPLLPLLFLLPALAVMMARPAEGAVLSDPRSRAQGVRGRGRRARIGLASVVVLALAAGSQPLLARWEANLGAVTLDRLELVGFPAGEWEDGDDLDRLVPAKLLLERALATDSANRTAHHRLGWLALAGRDFPNAVSHLELAYRSAPDHRGIAKMLGYSYTWAGMPERAVPLLEGIPEARKELETYIWWWGTQGRQDLSHTARQVLQLLEGEPGSFQGN